MNQPSSPASPALHTRAPAEQLRSLSSTSRPVPATIDTRNLEREVSGTGHHEHASAGHLDSQTVSHDVQAGRHAQRASASSTSISPVVTSNRVVRRRGSSRSSSFASNGDDAGEFMQILSPHLSPAPLSPNLAVFPPAGQDNIMQKHRRDVSADITNRGMHAHSLENSSNSAIIVYSPSQTRDEDTQVRPASSSAWSNFSLGREYGLDDSSSVDVTGNHNDDYQYTGGDDDARYLTAANAMEARSSDQHASSSHEDLENYAADLYTYPNGPRRGISRRVRGTEAYYRSSQNGMQLAGRPTRQRSLIENVHRGLRKMSVRVVNLAQNESEDHVPLTEDTEEVLEDSDSIATNGDPSKIPHKSGLDPEIYEPHLRSQGAGPSVTQDGPLRGKSMGLFGPQSRLRRAALKVFLWRYATLSPWSCLESIILSML